GLGVLGVLSVHWRVEMFLVPELRAERIFLVHVYVIETLGRHVPLVFDNGPVGTLQVRETGASGRLQTLRLAFSELGLGPSERSSGARQGIAADEHLATFV